VSRFDKILHLFLPWVRQHTPAARRVRIGNPCISPSLGLYPPHPKKKNKPYFSLFQCNPRILIIVLLSTSRITIKKPVMQIRISFHADPDPAFYLNADPDPGSQTNAVLCGFGSWSDFAITKSLILA
jgi:hypothetical protein